jgi:hypothetical protein
MKTLKSHNSYKNRRIKMTGLYYQLHIMTNYSIKYEAYRTNDIRAVAFTKWKGTDEHRDERNNRQT